MEKFEVQRSEVEKGDLQVIMEDKTKDQKDISPSATEDCADVTSGMNDIKKNESPQFPPVKYEKPPHH